MGSIGDQISRGSVSLLRALAGIVLIAILWELTKLLGTIIELPLSSSDRAMPRTHVHPHGIAIT